MNKGNQSDVMDRLQDYLERKTDSLSISDQARLDRLKSAHAYRLAHPQLTTLMLRNYLMSMYGLSIQQAYSDIALLNSTFGNLTQAEKNFRRFKANNLLDLGVAAAMAGDYRKAKAFKGLADSIVKVNNLDQDEGDQMPWDEIVPKDESFVIDPEVIGIKKVPNIEEKARKLLQKYSEEIDGIDEQEDGEQ